MKTSHGSFKLMIAGLALALTAPAFSQTLRDEGVAFHIKSFVKVEHDVTLGVRPQEERGGLDNALLQIRREAGASVMSALTPVLRSASDAKAPADARSVSLSILQAASALTDSARRFGVGQPGLAIHMNFIVYPTVLDERDGEAVTVTDNDDAVGAFTKMAVRNIENFKKSKFGRVLDGKLPLLPVAAAVSFRIDGLDGEATVQLINLVNPQELDGPNPISVPEVKRAADATMMFFEVSQPLKLKLPRIDLKFGKIGAIRRDGWVMRFDVSDKESFCSRSDSAPTLWQKQGLWIPLPLYHVVIDLNRPDAIVDADVRVGFLGTCPSFFGLVRSEFIKQANKQAADAVAMVTKLIGASPEEFAEQISRERKASGLDGSTED